MTTVAPSVVPGAEPIPSDVSVPTGMPGPVTGLASFSNASLYVGDLNPDVVEVRHVYYIFPLKHLRLSCKKFLEGKKLYSIQNGDHHLKRTGEERSGAVDIEE